MKGFSQIQVFRPKTRDSEIRHYGPRTLPPGYSRVRDGMGVPRSLRESPKFASRASGLAPKGQAHKGAGVFYKFARQPFIPGASACADARVHTGTERTKHSV